MDTPVGLLQGSVKGRKGMKKHSNKVNALQKRKLQTIRERKLEEIRGGDDPGLLNIKDQGVKET
jgi:hypothetical protein